jgi:hypothetical protein
MNRRSWLSVLGCLVLSGCGAAVGVGGGGVDNLVSTRIRTDSSEAIRQSVLEVFKAQEFSVHSQGPETITFSKRGGRTAEIAWTTIANPNPVMIRPTVRWRKTGDSEFTVTCRVEVVQQSTVRGEITRQPMMMGKSAYSRMLRDVRRRVEGGR